MSQRSVFISIAVGTKRGEKDNFGKFMSLPAREISSELVNAMRPGRRRRTQKRCQKMSRDDERMMEEREKKERRKERGKEGNLWQLKCNC